MQLCLEKQINILYTENIRRYSMAGVFEKIKAHLMDKTQKGIKTKTVYRFVSEREKKAIEENDLESIGSTWETDRRRNTHKYKEGVRYVHFVDGKKDALDVYHELRRSKKYLCTYDIPTDILKRYSGKGFYPPHGYNVSHTEIKEYAIPSSEYNPEWLQTMVLVDDKVKDEMCK